MDHANNDQVRRVAELLKGFAYLALAVYFLDGLIGFVKIARAERSFSGFLDASWGLIENLFCMGVLYIGLTASSHILLLLLDIKERK